MDGLTVVFDKIVEQITIPVILEHNGCSSKLLALIDTGAMHSTIPLWEANSLKLQRIGIVDAVFAKGHDTLPVVNANLIFSDKIYFKNKDLIVIDNDDCSYGMIVGMDILSQGDMAISNFNGHTTFTFRMPSQEETKYSDELITDDGINFRLDKIEDSLLST